MKHIYVVRYGSDDFEEDVYYASSLEKALDYVSIYIKPEYERINDIYFKLGEHYAIIKELIDKDLEEVKKEIDKELE